jgi:hypothetical protein
MLERTGSARKLNVHQPFEWRAIVVTSSSYFVVAAVRATGTDAGLCIADLLIVCVKRRSETRAAHDRAKSVSGGNPDKIETRY